MSGWIGAWGTTATVTNLIVTGSEVISVNTSTDALRITQTGAGNALLVEDDTNPDSTPFVINNEGKAFLGQSVGTSSFLGTSAALQINEGAGVAQSINKFTNNANGGNLAFVKGRGSPTVNTIVANGDRLGTVSWVGADGISYISAASIYAEIDGTPGTDDMPGRLVFSTTADGASSPTERMRIDNAGNVGIGGSPVTGASLSLLKNITGAATTYGVLNYPTILSGVTTAANLFQTLPTTQAAAFTLTTLRHYYANSQAFGAGSAVTNQFGFHAESTLTGATNNYGFYSNIASGTGRYNFYANGTADNYFAGPVTVSTSSTSDALRITQAGAGNALVVEDSANPDSTPFIVDANGRVGIGGNPSVTLESFSDATSWFRNQTAAGIPIFATYRANGTIASKTIVASGDETGRFDVRGWDGANFVQLAQINFYVDGTPGTNDMPGRIVFQTTADGASSPAERMRIDNGGNIYGTSGTTSMTNGFFYIPAAGGAPSGVPTAVAGRVPMYYDTTNNNFYIYNGAWKKILLA